MTSQLDVSSWLRCSATDSEGFHCQLSPSHPGEHRWFRCALTDAHGSRCALPPNHPGAHWGLWYDRPATAGETHTIRYPGGRSGAGLVADKAVRQLARHGWLQTSRHFEPGLLWRIRILSPLLALLGEPRGHVVAVFEYRPEADGSSPVEES